MAGDRIRRRRLVDPADDCVPVGDHPDQGRRHESAVGGGRLRRHHRGLTRVR